MSDIINIGDAMVILRSYLDADEAMVIKSALEANGVPAYLSAPNMAGMNYAVKTDIRVRMADKVRAEHVLAQVHMDSDAAATDWPDDISCPTCGVSHYERMTDIKPAFALLFAGLDPKPQHWFRCKHCGTRFHDGPTRFRSIGVAFAWAATLGMATLLVIGFIRWLTYF